MLGFADREEERLSVGARVRVGAVSVRLLQLRVVGHEASRRRCDLLVPCGLQLQRHRGLSKSVRVQKGRLQSERLRQLARWAQRSRHLLLWSNELVQLNVVISLRKRQE